MDIKALRHETKHVEWKPLLLLMHLVISFFNKIFTENPIPLTGEISPDLAGTQLSYIPATTGFIH